MKAALLIVVLITIVFAGGYFLVFRQNSLILPTTPSPSPDVAVPVSPTIDNSSLLSGGESYKDPQNVYTILYPADYKLDDQSDGKHTRLYKTGATQTGQTEMFDGVILVFETVDLKGSTLASWVNQNLTETTKDGTIKIVEPKKDVTINSYPGFTYSLRSLGEAKYYVLQKDIHSNYAVVIATSVNDPKNVGFQTEVDTILSTLKLLK